MLCKIADLRVIQRNKVYENKWMTLYEDQVVRSNGDPGIYGWIDKPTFAVIIPFDGRMVTLINQHRHPVGRRFWEFPMGAVEGANLTPQEIAIQELREETGLRAGRMTDLGHLYIAYGITNQDFHVWLAEDLVAGQEEREAEEQDLMVGQFSLAEIRAMVQRGEIVDAATVSALYLWHNFSSSK
jgi:8-oxo-dGTP pyrophosphatase MutT (NUDIX family)